MATYRYLAADLLTNTILDELPLTDVWFDLVLNGAGSFTGRLPIADPLVQAINPMGITIPGRTALYVDRDGVLLWGGILWTRGYDSADQALVLGGAEFESYFIDRYITTDAVFAATDQLAIARSLITTAQASPSGNLGVVIGSETSGVLRDRTYEGFELKDVLSALQQLAAVDNGFDFAIDVAYVAGVPTKSLRLNYPRRGQTAARTGWQWEFPGNIQSYTWPEDATTQAVRSWATGGGLGAGQLRASYTTTSSLDAGFPLLESKFAYGDVVEPATLQAHATADAKAMSLPVTIPTLMVRPDVDPTIGSYITGDEFRLRITDPRFPAPAAGGAGLDTVKRITRIKVTPPGQKEESVLLTLGDVVP